YGLNADPLAVMNFVGQSAVSNRVAIYVVSSSGFTDPVTLSASPSKIAGVEVTYVFYNHGTSVENATMTSDLYSKGIDMVIQAQTPIARGHYPDKITVTGASSIDHSVTISLDVNIIRPMFQEF
ncbi:MAG: hypothetical protein HYV67_01125, partial [Candidatus Taylorbacteria bacterium]|nr:hypothetical protein [Candidatus Taylorbacteria bacterium]